MELEAIELGAIEDGADEDGAVEDGADEDAAAGVLLLGVVELEAAVLLEPQAATTRANTATPATTPVRPTALLLDGPWVVVTRTSSSWWTFGNLRSLTAQGDQFELHGRQIGELQQNVAR